MRLDSNQLFLIEAILKMEITPEVVIEVLVNTSEEALERLYVKNDAKDIIKYHENIAKVGEEYLKLMKP